MFSECRDEIFNSAPSGDSMIQVNTKKQKYIFSGLQEKADMSFADPDDNGATDVLAKSEEKEDESDTDESVEDKVGSKKDIPADSVEDIFENLTGENTDEEETRDRKSISGISDVFSKLIKEDKIVAFDDDNKNQVAAWKLLVDRLLPLSYCDKDQVSGGRSAVNIAITGVGVEITPIGGESIVGEERGTSTRCRLWFY